MNRARPQPESQSAITAIRLGVVRLLAGPLFLALLMLAALPAAFAASEASVEAREENGFGRIVLSFNRLPAYRKELDAGIFVIWFDDPVDADLGEIPKDLPDYIGLARRDPDGRAIRLALNRSYLVNLMEAGDQLYIDILPPTWKGLPPPLPTHVIKALSRLAAETERKAREEARQREAAKFPYELDVRLARHPTFTRIVFDWNKFVTVNLGRQGRNVTVEFGAQVDTDLAILRADPPKFLRNAQIVKHGDGMELHLTVDDDVDVRGFREGMTYVIDLTGPDAAAAASASKTAQTAGAQPGVNANPLPPGAQEKTALPAQIGGEASATQTRGRDNVKIRMRELIASDLQLGEFADTDAVPDAVLKALEPDKVVEKSPPDAATLAALPKPRPEPKPKPDPSVAAKPEPVAPPEPAANAGVPLPDRKPNEIMAAEVPAEAAGSPASVPGTGDDVTVLADDSGAKLKLTFPFKAPVAASAFRRGNTIWLVFDSAAKLDVEALKDAQGAKLTGVQHIHAGSMQYLRLQLTRAWLTYVRTDEAAWIVEIGDMVTGRAQTLHLERKLRTDKRSVIGIKLEKPGRIHWLADPDIGDRLAIVTAFPPQRSVGKPQDFVEFRALRTAHGIAIRPNSDDIAIRLQLDEVVITRRHGLTLSAGNAGQYMAGRKSLEKAARLGFLDVEGWGVKEPAKYSERIHALHRAVVQSPDNEKNDQRFALARLFFSNGFAMESYAVLRRMKQIDPFLENDPSFNVLRGAALTMIGRTTEARKDFEVHALANDPDAALWRGLLDVADKNWESALQQFEDGRDAIDSYSPELQARFRLAAVRAALELSRLNRAADELDALPKTITAPSLAMDGLLMRGWYLESIGRSDEAIEAYDKVLSSDQRPAVAEAELRTIDLLLRDAKISRSDALKRLERLQLVWRGDDIELRAMQRLANLYVEESRYRDAFMTMKNGVQAYPQSRLSLLMQDEMKEVFKSLYLDGENKKIEPIESLGLFYDFRQLTPVGRQGDEMIRRLSDRLVEFDLLDQASEVLDHQVYKRLKGAARSQVATRLAMVHLMNHKPELALKAIRQTRQAGLSNELRRSRNLLEARALGELGRAEAAIEILNTMKGDEIERLKADALWSAQQWQKAGEQMEKMLGGRWQETAELNEMDRFDVLRTAVSYSLSGDQFALDRVRKKFYEKMVKTPDAESFMVMTKPVKAQNASFRDLAKEIAAIDTLNAFMKEFRERYDSDAGSARSTTQPAPGGAG